MEVNAIIKMDMCRRIRPKGIATNQPKVTIIKWNGNKKNWTASLAIGSGRRAIITLSLRFNNHCIYFDQDSLAFSRCELSNSSKHRLAAYCIPINLVLTWIIDTVCVFSSVPRLPSSRQKSNALTFTRIDCNFDAAFTPLQLLIVHFFHIEVMHAKMLLQRAKGLWWKIDTTLVDCSRS